MYDNTVRYIRTHQVSGESLCGLLVQGPFCRASNIRQYSVFGKSQLIANCPFSSHSIWCINSARLYARPRLDPHASFNVDLLYHHTRAAQDWPLRLLNHRKKSSCCFITQGEFLKCSRLL